MKRDLLIALIFWVLTALFIAIAISNEAFFQWAFERHHNPWSWYVRPLFLIPFCFFAYKHSHAGMAMTIFCLFTSMFWFSKPDVVSPSVEEFLQMEKVWIQGDWNASKMALLLRLNRNTVNRYF